MTDKAFPKKKSGSNRPQLCNTSDDPLRSNHIPRRGSSSSSNVFTDPTFQDQLEWDNVMMSDGISSPWVRNPDLDERSAVFQLSKELEEANNKLEKCRQRIKSYQEVLESRDQQLFDIQDKMSDRVSKEAIISSETYAKMEEQARSYKEQNNLLNEEVLKMHQTCRKSRQLASEYKKTSDRLRAELRRFQRDFVDLLGQFVRRPLGEPVSAILDVTDSDRHVATLKQLTRQMKEHNEQILGCNLPSVGKKDHVDVYRFHHHLPNEAIQVEYASRHLTEAFDRIIDQGANSVKNLNKWKSYTVSNSDHFEINHKLQELILDDVHGQYRAYIWQKMIHCYVGDVRRESGENYYHELLQCKDAMLVSDKSFAKNVKQIRMDVPRTMPTNRDFTPDDSPLRSRLSRVLTAFCIHSPHIGYCQGFNFIVGGSLLFLEEEDAFWFLVAVTEIIFPVDYYHNGLAGLLADQRVLQAILPDHCPRLLDHFKRYHPDFDLATLTTSWFLALFFDSFPFQTLIRVWDCFLAYGHIALFRVACALFTLHQEQLLDIHEPSQLLHAIKNMPRLCNRPEKIIHEAFRGLHNFPEWDEIDGLRCEAEAELISEHERMLQQRREFQERVLNVNAEQTDKCDDRWSYDACSSSLDGRMLVTANCPLADTSQLYSLDPVKCTIRNIELPVMSRVMCCKLVSEDDVLVGLLTGQVQCYSLCQGYVRWSTSLSNVVMCFEVVNDHIFVGTADGKLHILKTDEAMVRPLLVDSTDMSKSPTTCMCVIPSESSLWVASGPSIYVLSIETMETDGFFLISSRLEQVSNLQHCSLTTSTGEQGLVWIARLGSTVLQLRDVIHRSVPLLVFDIQRRLSLPLLQPMMESDETSDKAKEKNLPACITSMSTSHDALWVGTGEGRLKKFRLVTQESKDNKHDEQDAADSATFTDPLRSGASAEASSLSSLPQDDISEFTLVLDHDLTASDKLVRCLLPAGESDMISCSGFHDDPGSVKRWTGEGEFTALVNVTDADDSSNERVDVDQTVTGTNTRDSVSEGGGSEMQEMASSIPKHSISMPHIANGANTSTISSDQSSLLAGDSLDSPNVSTLSNSLSHVDAIETSAGGDGERSAWKSTLKSAAANAFRTYRSLYNFNHNSAE